MTSCRADTSGATKRGVADRGDRGHGAGGRGERHFYRDEIASGRRIPDRRRTRPRRRVRRPAFANPYVAAARGYLDDVIEPRETRPPTHRRATLSGKQAGTRTRVASTATSRCKRGGSASLCKVAAGRRSRSRDLSVGRDRAPWRCHSRLPRPWHPRDRRLQRCRSRCAARARRRRSRIRSVRRLLARATSTHRGSSRSPGPRRSERGPSRLWLPVGERGVRPGCGRRQPGLRRARRRRPSSAFGPGGKRVGAPSRPRSAGPGR